MKSVTKKDDGFVLDIGIDFRKNLLKTQHETI